MLPQRRKSAEEIAKLREAMGIPGAEAPADAPAPASTPPEPQASIAAQAVPSAPQEIPVTVREAARPPEPQAPRAPKAVKSLRRSERVAPSLESSGPSRTSAASPGAIPVRKRTEEELMELRRRTAAPPEQSLTMIANLGAPWWMVGAPYFLCIVALFVGWSTERFNEIPVMDFPADWIGNFYTSPSTPEIGKWVTIAICAAALGIAGWIAWKKPRSRHHSGFVTIIAVLVITFGIIYHQPLPHGP